MPFSVICELVISIENVKPPKEINGDVFPYID